MVEPKLARAYGTLAGFGFIGVALLAVPSTRLLDPLPAPEAYLLTLLGLVTGLVCLAIPWDRLDPRWLHLIGAVAIAETAATVAVFGMPYVAFYFLIAVLVAYVAPDPRTLGIQLGLIVLALIGPVVYGPEGARSSLSVALVVTPPLLLTAGLFSYLRMKMVHDRRAYHHFAEQTLVLSSRIAGRQSGPMGLVPHPEPVARLSRLRPPRAWIAGTAAVLGVPLFAGGLAVAGVQLPDVATSPFQRVGIELPNQETAAAEADLSQPPATRAQARGGGSTESVSAGSGGKRPAEEKAVGSQESAAGSSATAPPASPPIAAGEGSQTTSSESAAPIPSDPTKSGGDGEAQSKSPQGGLLEDATQGLQGLFDELKLSEK